MMQMRYAGMQITDADAVDDVYAMNEYANARKTQRKGNRYRQ